MAQFGDIVLKGRVNLTGVTYDDFALSSEEKRKIFGHWLIIAKDVSIKENNRIFEHISLLSRIYYHRILRYICICRYLLNS